MKKLFFAAALVMCLQAVTAQTTATDSTSVTEVSPNLSTAVTPALPKRKIDLSNRSNDHFMFQYGFDNWAATPDSINPKGFSRFFNAYIMLDKPFKTNPKMSVGLGVGIGSSNIFFENTFVDVKALTTQLPFRNVDSANHFKKFKLTTIFLEAPVELRYSSNPENSNKSFKGALGVKVVHW